MKAPTPEVRAIIEQLRQPDSFFGKLTGKAVRLKLKLLDQLMTYGDLWTVPSIFRLVLGASPKVARKAAQVIHAIVIRQPTHHLLDLDHQIRQISSYRLATGDYPDLRNGLSANIERLAQFGEARTTLLGIASFDASGYVREAAVKELSRIGAGAAFPFILIRLGDWVARVREAAEQAFASLLKNENASIFIENLILAARLNERGRIDNTPLQSIIELMKNAEAHPLLLAQLQKPFSLIRRECIRILLTDFAYPPLDLHSQIAEPIELSEELLITDAALKHTPEQELQHAYNRFAGSRFKGVRMRALSLFNQRQPELATEALWAALFDTRPVRTYAQFTLKQRGSGAEAIAQAYRQALHGSSPKRLKASLAGLGAMGSIQDYELIEQFIDHPRVDIVRTAIHTLARLAPGQCYPTLVRQLQSPEVRVSKQAMEEIIGNLDRADFGELWELFRNTATPHVRRHLIQIFNLALTWERLKLLLGVMCHGDAAEQDTARIHLGDLFVRLNRSFIQPTPRQIKQIQEHLDQLNLQNYGHLVRAIRQTIQQRL